MQLVFGFFPAQLIQVAARLRIADELAGGPRSTAELANATDTHEASLYRLLRALVFFDVLAEPAPGHFELTERGDLLRSDGAGSVRNIVMLFCGPEVWRSWGELEHSVRTDQPAWDHLYGLSAFEYMAKEPEFNAIFNEAMAEATRTAAPGVVAAGDFSRFDTVVDVGGGNGALVAAILSAHPDLQAVLFDTELGLEDAPRLLETEGVTDRCRVVAGNFFEDVPDGADAYVLKSVIHDWDDERSIAILANCRRAMPVDGTLLIVEPVMPARIEPSPDVFFMVMSDLNMLACTGGKERTKDEFRALLDAAELELRKVTPCPGPTNFSVLEAACAGNGGV
ncbi:MAG: methyltransferase [Acidimicrobiales bacterium]